MRWERIDEGEYCCMLGKVTKRSQYVWDAEPLGGEPATLRSLWLAKDYVEKNGVAPRVLPASIKPGIAPYDFRKAKDRMWGSIIAEKKRIRHIYNGG